MKNIFKPILFSTQMVQAILEGRKTQTRRTKGLETVNNDWRSWEFVDFTKNSENEEDKRKCAIFRCYVDTWHTVVCPYQVDEILWVRETFYPKEINAEPPGVLAHYKASDPFASDKWKPSIFMPKDVCRIFLKVVSVKVERLQNISEKDAQLEGASDRLNHSDMELLTGLKDWIIPSPFLQHQFGFLAIWCKINGCESWLKNPWVWVIEFERIEKPLDFIV